MDGIACLWLSVGPLVGAIIGSFKNQPIAGALLGLICGPFGWILAIISSPKGKQCPHCRTKGLDAKATVCPKCTRTI